MSSTLPISTYAKRIMLPDGHVWLGPFDGEMESYCYLPSCKSIACDLQNDVRINYEYKCEDAECVFGSYTKVAVPIMHKVEVNNVPPILKGYGKIFIDEVTVIGATAHSSRSMVANTPKGYAVVNIVSLVLRARDEEHPDISIIMRGDIHLDIDNFRKVEIKRSNVMKTIAKKAKLKKKKKSTYVPPLDQIEANTHIVWRKISVESVNNIIK